MYNHTIQLNPFLCYISKTQLMYFISKCVYKSEVNYMYTCILNFLVNNLCQGINCL